MTKVKVSYELKLKKLEGETILGSKVGIPEWEPYAVAARAIFNIKKLEGKVNVVFGYGSSIGIPITNKYFTAKEVTTKTIITKKNVKIGA